MTEASPASLRHVVLVGGDRAEVAQHVGQVDPERPRVAAHALLLGQHGRVVLGLLEDPQGDGLADVGGDGHGLVRRPVPADADLAARRHRTTPASGGSAAGCIVEHVRPAAYHDLGAVLAELAEQGAVDADDPRRAVGHERAALVVDDQAALGLDDDVAQRLRGSAGVVGLAADDLEVVEPGEQGGEQREHQDLDDEHPQPAALGPHGVALTPAVPGPARASVKSRISTRQHERRQQHVPEDPGHDHGQQVADRDDGVLQQQAADARRSRCRRTTTRPRSPRRRRPWA